MWKKPRELVSSSNIWQETQEASPAPLSNKGSKSDVSEGEHVVSSSNVTWRETGDAWPATLSNKSSQLDVGEGEYVTPFPNFARETRGAPPATPSNESSQPHVNGRGYVASLSSDAAEPPLPITTKAASLDINDLSDDQVIIAVVGPAGAGKSSFIAAATGGDVHIGHGLEPGTTEIKIVKYDCPDKSDFDIVFIDTPGFDGAESGKTDVEILEMTADWLNKTYKRKIILTGILYFHRISDNRVAGTPLGGLRMFKELCGEDALENIILTTTMWDEVTPEEGAGREAELRSIFWKAMIDQGSTITRFHMTRESAWDVLDYFVQDANARYAVLLQKEMTKLKKQLQVPETSAGQLYTELEGLARKQQVTLRKIRDETKFCADAAILDTLKAEYEDLRTQIATIVGDMQTLKISLGKRIPRLSRSLASNTTKPLPTSPMPSEEEKRKQRILEEKTAFIEGGGKQPDKGNHNLSGSIQKRLIRLTSTAKAVPLDIDDLSDDQVIIAVMGPPGAGKSSFIDAATGGHMYTSHETELSMSEIKILKYEFLDKSDLDVVFVDIPGFDNIERTDLEILQMIADWLNKTYERKIMLTGILYLHPILDDRMSSNSFKHLCMFRELCGRDVLQNVILTTTMWDEVEPGVGARREAELRSKGWKEMINQGSATARFHGTQESAWDILDHFIRDANARRAVLLQKEMTELNTPLGGTNVGRRLYTRLEALVHRQHETIRNIQGEARYHTEPAVLDALRAEYDRLRMQLAADENDMQALQTPLGVRILRLIWGPMFG